MNSSTIDTIRSRRVTRFFDEQRVSKHDLETVVEAARWAPSAGNRRLQKFIVVQTPCRIYRIRAMAPGLDGYPTALVVICTDWRKAQNQGLSVGDCHVFIDVGTAAENMLLAAHALGLGAGPITSYSKAAVQALLDLPDWLSPDLIVCLGHPAEVPRGRGVKSPTPLQWQDLTYWEHYEESASAEEDRSPP